jgi:hypothetical protein
LLLEEPYGFFGTLNPTGHNAIYLARVCADTPVHLRRCNSGESGSVIARYQGISGYDWVAIPLVPYLYSVDNLSDVPTHVNRESVSLMLDKYHETHLLSLGDHLPEGSLFWGGWSDLVGEAYQRRMYAFRFETTAAQDDAFIAKMNASRNRSHFNLFYNNCADFSREVLNFYFPHAFRRNIFPDAAMTTPKLIAWKLERYARKHPEMQLSVYEIPQISGYRRKSHSNRGVAESLATLYAVPLALVNPYLAGGLLIDDLMLSRLHSIPEHPRIVTPENLSILTLPALTVPTLVAQNPDSAGSQASGAAEATPAESPGNETANSGQKETKATHE